MSPCECFQLITCTRNVMVRYGAVKDLCYSGYCLTERHLSMVKFSNFPDVTFLHKYTVYLV